VLLELKNIKKNFGGVAALRDGNLSVNAGEVHLLMGENGAGKSTLMKIVAGMLQRDGGQMLWNGAEVNLRSPSDAAALGVAMVHQESLLAPHLSVAENIFLGREYSTKFGWVHRKQMTAQAKILIEHHKFPLQAEWIVEKLSPAGKQLVEICRAVYHGSNLLIFDEPTSSLSNSETAEVFKIVRTLCERNVGVIYITHRLEELRSIGKRVTVLRDGQTVHSGALADLTREQLIAHMVGRQVAATYSREAFPPGETLLEVENLSVKKKLHNVSLKLRAGEIVGMAGLIGAGRTELCRAIFGVDKPESGRVLVDGKPVRIDSPRTAVKAGIALVTEDRQITGLALQLPISINTTMANVERISRFGFLNLEKQNAAGAEYIEKLRIKAQSGKQLAGRLSGGNQQKVVIAKWLFRQARVFLFDEPTRGIDVGAKVEVFDLMNELAKQGAAILMVSSELPELIQVADRIVVMRQGSLSGELRRGATQEDIMHLAALEETTTERVA
jgi:ABC-type sugar transport system ATPase subunit